MIRRLYLFIWYTKLLGYNDDQLARRGEHGDSNTKGDLCNRANKNGYKNGHKQSNKIKF